MDIQSELQSYYTDHLSRLNERNPVLASEDIVNMQGALIVAKGQPITPLVAKRIAQHKLIKPIDHSVKLEQIYSSKRIFDCMLNRFNSAGLIHLIDDAQVMDQLRTNIELACEQALIQQKISVLAECLPDSFQHTLLVAGLSLSICKQLKLEDPVSHNVFLAALLADTGLLHLDPRIASKKTQFSPKEWLLYQGHVAISKSFVDMVPGISKAVGLAIMQHHERSDGFGYPFQKFGDELSQEGQIIATSDKIIAIHRKRVLEEGYDYSLVIPVLQFSSTSTDPSLNEAALRLLYQSPKTAIACKHNRDTLQLIPSLLTRLEHLKKWMFNTQRVIDSAHEELNNPLLVKHIALHRELRNLLDTSGLLSKHQQLWLQDVLKNNDENEFAMVEQFSVLLSEMEYQCRNAQRQFDPLIPELFGVGAVAARVKQTSQKISLLLTDNLKGSNFRTAV